MISFVTWPLYSQGKNTFQQFGGSSSGSDRRGGRFGEQKRLLAVSDTEGQSLGLLGYSLDTTRTAVSRLPFDYTCLIVEFTKVMKFSYRSTYLVKRTYQLLQFEETNAHNFLKVTILQYTSSYIFRATLAHNQGAHNCTQHVYFSVLHVSAENSSLWNIYVGDLFAHLKI